MKGSAVCAILFLTPKTGAGTGGTVVKRLKKETKKAPSTPGAAPKEPPRSTYVRRCAEARGPRGLKHYG